MTTFPGGGRRGGTDVRNGCSLDNAMVLWYLYGMWPVKNKVPDEKGVEQARQTTAQDKGGSQLWAELRRLKARLGQIELVLSNTRRDVARIDRKNYRDKVEEPATEQPQEDHRFPGALFG